MDYVLTLDKNMHLTSDREVILTQGTHNADRIVLELGEQCSDGEAYLEFSLPRARTYVTERVSISGNIYFAIPYSVTVNFGFGYLCFCILAGGILKKTPLLGFEIVSSITQLNGRDKGDISTFLLHADRLLNDVYEGNIESQNLMKELNNMMKEGYSTINLSKPQ